MQQTTICLLVKDDNVLLAMKKRGHGIGKWNGVGGKVKDGESLEEAAIRESHEEIGVTPLNLVRVAIITFNYTPEPTSGHISTVFLCDKWDGEPVESEEMRPQWFSKSNIPYEDMWWSDHNWLPKLLAGKKIVATVRPTWDNKNEYIEQEVETL